MQDSFNDLVDILPKDLLNDKISILYEANKTTNVAVKTPFGITERREIKDSASKADLGVPFYAPIVLTQQGKNLFREMNFNISTKIISRFLSFLILTMFSKCLSVELILLKLTHIYAQQ